MPQSQAVQGQAGVTRRHLVSTTAHSETQGSRPGLQDNIVGFSMPHRDWIKSVSSRWTELPGEE